MSGVGDIPGGLRDRKRTAAMYRIQTEALDLFEERGFDDVTVEEIAEVSEVSPSSIYRYFGTKEELVLWDEFDPGMSAVLEAALSDVVPLDGIRRVMMGGIGGMSPADERRLIRRLRLAATSPSLAQAAVARSYVFAEMVEQVLAEQLGRPVDDLEVQVFSHALIGGLLGMFHHWQGTDFAEPLAKVLGRTFTIFEGGLDIVSARAPDVSAAAAEVSGD
jgi:AcrR family transcriptional regulator